MKEFTDEEDSGSEEITKEKEEASDQANNDDKETRLQLSNWAFLVVCAFAIIATFTLLGIVIYLVLEERKEVCILCFNSA